MPNIKSAIKRMRQNVVRSNRNSRTKRLVKSNVRNVVTAIANKDKKAVVAAYQSAQAEIDKAVKRGVLHKNKAARKKAQLARQVNEVVGKVAKTTKKAAPKKAAKAPAKKPAAKKPAPKKAVTKKATK